MTISWTDAASDFLLDGSLRDVYIIEGSAEVWRAVMTAILAQYSNTVFTRAEVVTEPPTDWARHFSTAEDRGHLKVDVAGVVFVCHFFDVGEVEFDIYPREVKGQAELNAIFEFMSLLARASGSDVVLTPENMQLHPLFRVRASTLMIERTSRYSDHI